MKTRCFVCRSYTRHGTELDVDHGSMDRLLLLKNVCLPLVPFVQRKKDVLLAATTRMSRDILFTDPYTAFRFSLLRFALMRWSDLQFLCFPLPARAVDYKTSFEGCEQSSYSFRGSCSKHHNLAQKEPLYSN